MQIYISHMRLVKVLNFHLTLEGNGPFSWPEARLTILGPII